MRATWILAVFLLSLTLVLDVGAKVKPEKVDKKAQKKQKNKKKEQAQPAVNPQVIVQPVYIPTPEVKLAEPKLVKLKEAQEGAQKQTYPDVAQAHEAAPQRQTGYSQGYPYPSPSENGDQGYDPSLNGQQRPPESQPEEPVFVPDLAKLKFVKPKRYQRYGRQDSCPCRNCGCGQQQQRGGQEERQTGQDRVAEAFHDPNYIYLKMVPADELPEEGSPEAECPLLVFPRKDEHLARGCLRLLKAQADEAVAQYEAERRWQEQQRQHRRDAEPAATRDRQGETSHESSDTGSLMGDVKHAIKKATDRQADRVADAVKDEVDETDQPRTSNQGRRNQPPKVLEANKGLENEPIGPNGYEGIGSI